MGAVSDNQVGSYWTSSGPYDEIFYYIGENTDAVKNDIARMLVSNPIPIKVWEYVAASMELKTRDEIFRQWWFMVFSIMTVGMFLFLIRS